MKKKIISIFISLFLSSFGCIIGLFLGVSLIKGIIISIFGCLLMTIFEIIIAYTKLKINEHNSNTEQI